MDKKSCNKLLVRVNQANVYLFYTDFLLRGGERNLNLLPVIVISGPPKVRSEVLKNLHLYKKIGML